MNTDDYGKPIPKDQGRGGQLRNKRTKVRPSIGDSTFQGCTID